MKLKPVPINVQIKNMKDFINMIHLFLGDERERLQVAAAQNYNARALEERALYQQYSCQACHKVNTNGEIPGSALESLAADKGELVSLIKLKSPRFNNPSSTIPRMQLSEGEIKALTGFLSTF